MMTYPMHVAGLVRDLPICKVTEDFYIGAFIMFGDADSQQLDDLATLSNGKVFDGRNGNLSGIFREVKGYN